MKHKHMLYVSNPPDFPDAYSEWECNKQNCTISELERIVLR